MENKHINLKEVRDFGQVFNTGIYFIKQEFKLLGTAILFYVIPFTLLSSILMVVFSLKQQQIMGDAMSGGADYFSNPFAYLGAFSGIVTLMMLFMLIAITMLNCTVIAYIKLYTEKGKDAFNLNDIRQQIASNFFPVLGALIVIGIIIMVGTMFCIIPGIYFGVTLSLVITAMMIEQKGFSDAFSRSFSLIKDNWWLTFGLLFVANLMVYAITAVFSIPGAIFGLKSMFMNLQNVEDLSNMTFPTGYYVYSAVTNLISYTLMAVPLIMILVHYFSLVEQKDKPSLEDKISQISPNE